MIERLVPLAYFKREPFYGSYKGMQYRVMKEEDQLQAVVFPAPYNFKTTEEEEKEYKTFPFTQDGSREVLDWLNERYETRKEKWENAPKW